MAEYEIDVERGENLLYVFPAVTRSVVDCGDTKIDDVKTVLTSVFGKSMPLVLGVEALVVLKGMWLVSGEDPMWFELMAQIEKMGKVVITEKENLGWEWCNVSEVNHILNTPV